MTAVAAARRFRPPGRRTDFGTLPMPATTDLKGVWSALVGKIVAGDDEAEKRREMNARLDAIIARKLEAGGVKCRREATTAIVDFPLDGSAPITVRENGALEMRRWQIFFTHQAAVGRETKKRLELVAQQLGRQARFIRMGVISAGWVSLDELREQIARIRACVSRIEKIFARYGIELLFSNFEAPIMRADDGTILVNLHSHILRLDTRALGDTIINEMNDRIRRQAKRSLDKAYFHDAGKVESLEELTKYVSKGDPAPGEDADESKTLECNGARKIGVEELTIEETVAWHEAMHRTKRFKPHGRAKDLWRALDVGVTTIEEDEFGLEWPKTRRMKIASLGKGEDGKRKLVLTPKWAAELRPAYGRNAEAPTNVIMGTSIRAVDREDGRRLVGCLRVMAPSGTLEQIVLRRKLQYVVALHARVIAANLAIEAREAGPSIRDNRPLNFGVPSPGGSKIVEFNARQRAA